MGASCTGSGLRPEHGHEGGPLSFSPVRTQTYHYSFHGSLSGVQVPRAVSVNSPHLLEPTLTGRWTPAPADLQVPVRMSRPLTTLPRDSLLLDQVGGSHTPFILPRHILPMLPGGCRSCACPLTEAEAPGGQGCVSWVVISPARSSSNGWIWWVLEN